MTGYQEILTDPSYAGQIITFTFPHIGNVGTNDEDIETVNMAARGRARLRAQGPTSPSRRTTAPRAISTQWLKARGIIGIAGVDTRALTALIRENGMPNASSRTSPDGKFRPRALKREAALAGPRGHGPRPSVTCARRYTWDETPWVWGKGYGRQENPASTSSPSTTA
jgi:carbamoyl-phosphate synthase small subunit